MSVYAKRGYCCWQKPIEFLSFSLDTHPKLVKMSARYTQSKAETQRHLEILKGMLKQPENKVGSLLDLNSSLTQLTPLSLLIYSCAQIVNEMVSPLQSHLQSIERLTRERVRVFRSSVGFNQSRLLHVYQVLWDSQGNGCTHH